ncbi:MAG: RNA-binding protein [Deltaproteobacteria bacterium]|nr:RNA-binding protein [Deltaproteobacteria bacterium]
MGKKLYVGNLPFSATDEALQSLFASAGTVESAKVITDRDSGRSKGFGFVEMSSDEEAANAVQSLNEKDFEGRKLTVSEARPQAPRTGGGGGGRGFGGGGGGGRREGGGGGGRGFGGGGGGGRRW